MSVLSLKNLTKILNRPGNFSLKRNVFSIAGLPSRSSLKETLNFLDALLEFAPEVRLHPEDSTRPSSVEFYLAHVDLWYKGVDKPILSAPSIDELINQNVGQAPLTISSGSSNTPTNFYLRIKENVKERARKGEWDKFQNGQVTQDVPCYCHARKVQNQLDTWDLQYLFFYPYNDMSVIGIGDHDGDWEHITIRVKLGQTREILGVYFSAHDKEGGWAKVESFTGPTLFPRHVFFARNKQGQIQVFSAKDSHASIEGIGEISRGFPKPNDFTSNSGPIWNCRSKLLFVGEREAPSPGQHWIKFTGYWGGEVESVGSPWFQGGGWWKILEEPNAPKSV